MKIQHVTELFQRGDLERVEIRRNPGDREEWFVMVILTDGKLVMLADDNDKALTAKNLDTLFSILTAIGLNCAEVFF